MKFFLSELKKRNALLYWFGWYNFIMGILCIILIPLDDHQILGISRWIKPMKFFLSVAIMVWTMAWLLYYLEYKKKIRIISWLIVITMFIENFLIMLQSTRGVQSHFNVHDPLNAMVFSIMGISIVLFTFTIIFALILFFRQKKFSIPTTYLWSIRLGLLFFIIFSAEGGLMVSRLSHTVGGADGGPGLPLVNWSTRYGDLRIAHFLGIHSLQILPLAGYFIFKRKSEIFIFSLSYFAIVTSLLVLALKGFPLVS